MKKIVYIKKLFLAFFLLICFIVKAEERIVDNPPFSICTHSNVIVDKIELKDTETILYMTINLWPGYWIRIASDTYIRANEQKYIVDSAEGIELDKDIFPDDSGKIIFTLHFPAIDPATQQLDFIESDCSNCFKIWGLELQPGISAQRSKVPEKIKKEAVIEDDGKSLEIPHLEFGEATFNGQFLGYVPELNWSIELYINNPVTGEQESLETQIKDDGSFELKVPLVTSMQVLFRTTFYNSYVLLSPGKETTVYVDLFQKSSQETQNEALKSPAGKYMYFGGANAEINNQMEDKKIAEMKSNIFDQTNDPKTILNMSAEQYKVHVLEIMYDAIEELSQKGLTKKAYEFAVMDIYFSAISMLMFADSNLASAFRREHNLDYRSEMPGYTEPVFDEAYYSFLKEIPFNNQFSLYNASFGNMVNSCKYLDNERVSISVCVPTNSFYQELIDSGKLSQEEKKYAEFLQKMSADNWSDEKQQKYRSETAGITRVLIDSEKLYGKVFELAKELLSLCDDPTENIISVVENRSVLMGYLHYFNLFSEEEFDFLTKQEEQEIIEEPECSEEVKKSWNEKYREALDLFAEKNNRKKGIDKKISYLAEILGTSQGIVFDMMTTQLISKKFEEFIPLTAEELKEIAQMENPFYFNYINQQNNELLAKIETNKNKKGFNIHDVPETDEEKLFSELLLPFAGKVILVDFWATWCAPCRSAMKQFESAKERLKDKDVAFVYLTDESSPLAAWQNMIPNIPGEHFRLKNDQFNYLKKKFGVNGVPSYLILNKSGEQIYFKVGFEGAEKLERLIIEAI